MKTYNLYCLLLVCLVVSSCSKTEGVSVDDGKGNPPGTEASYTILLTSGGTLKSTLLDANGERVALSPTESPFAAIPVPDFTYKEGTTISMYRSGGSCIGDILRYDFGDGSPQELTVFEDLGTCSLTAYAIAHSNNAVYVAFGLEETSKETGYFVRAIDLDSAEFDFVDVPLDKKPMDLTYANDRLFVLTLDEEITNENALSVLDAGTNTLTIEIGLGYDAHRIITNVDGNVIISYDELHTVLNSETLAEQYVNYQTGKEPNFVSSESTHFDEEGSLYYAMESGDFSMYPLIPAVYNFSENLTTLYAYENFLTEAERDLEYKIETTTMVGFDGKNGYLLIGYKKLDGSGKGGLLRIKPAPEPAVIDNLELDGIPYDIIVK